MCAWSLSTCLSISQSTDEGGLLGGPHQAGHRTLEDYLVADHLLVSPGARKQNRSSVFFLYEVAIDPARSQLGLGLGLGLRLALGLIRDRAKARARVGLGLGIGLG